APPVAPVAPVAPAVVETKPEPPTGLAADLPPDWQAALAAEFARPYFPRLGQFLSAQRAAHAVWPAPARTFLAFRLAAPEQVRVVLLGDAPADAGAHGLSFSVRPGAPRSAPVVSLLRELRSDLGCRVPDTGCLVPWARQGVLLLNTRLTARAGDPDAHAQKGWEAFTDAVVRTLAMRAAATVFVLCGETAWKKRPVIGNRQPTLIAPAPTDERFAGSQVFSTVNDALERRGRAGVYWQLYAV